MWYSMDMDASISRMLVFLKRFERAIVTVLIVLMVLVIALATIEVGWLILQDITSPPSSSWRSTNSWTSSGNSSWCWWA